MLAVKAGWPQSSLTLNALGPHTLQLVFLNILLNQLLFVLRTDQLIFQTGKTLCLSGFLFYTNHLVYKISHLSGEAIRKQILP